MNFFKLSQENILHNIYKECFLIIKLLCCFEYKLNKFLFRTKMKFIISFLLLFLTINASKDLQPTPLQSLDLSKVTGTWYLVMAYPEQIFQGYSCYTWEVSITNGQEGHIAASYVINNKTHHVATPMLVSDHGLDWSVIVIDYKWLAIDQKDFLWGVIGVKTNQAFIISRNPSLDKRIIESQIAFLQQEGFDISSSNYVMIPNDNCDGIEKFDFI